MSASRASDDSHGVVVDDWPVVRAKLPADLDESARVFRVLERERRITSGDDLLRLALLYGGCGLSLRATAARAAVLGFANMSDVAVLYRLEVLAPWLQHVLDQCLDQAAEREAEPRALAVHLIDATTVRMPGRVSPDSCFRVHTRLDLATNRLQAIQVTPTRGKGEGETLCRFAAGPGDVLVADRGYCSRKQFAYALGEGASFVVRFHSTHVPLYWPGGGSVDFLDLVRTLSESQPVGDWSLEFEYYGKRHPIRLVALRLDDTAREAAEAKAARKACRNQSAGTARSREAAGYVIVLTNLPAESFAPQDILDIYRLRWRVETYFKRLKSELGLERMRARSTELALTHILCKLIMAYLLEEWIDDWLPELDAAFYASDLFTPDAAEGVSPPSDPPDLTGPACGHPEATPRTHPPGHPRSHHAPNPAPIQGTPPAILETLATEAKAREPGQQTSPHHAIHAALT